MRKNNPYTIMFGREPSQMVSRITQRDEIINTFTSDVPSSQIFFITGVRGSGKTVLMSEISARLAAEKKWITVEISPMGDMLAELASKIYHTGGMSKWLKTAGIDLSFFGIGMKIKSAEPVTNIEIALRRILGKLKKEGKRLLITMDEAVSSKEMRIFASAFQIFMREKLPVFLIMTGLYKNIDVLRNDKVLTFLLRTPRINLGSLNIRSMQNYYTETFQLPEEDALEMAHMTKGYPFAFQVLGYHTYEHHGDYQKAVEPTRLYLEEYVYEKLWTELSDKEKKICTAIAGTESGKVLDIRKKLDIETNEFSPYRANLIKKGILDGSNYGHISFTLPFFDDFVRSC